MDAKKSVQECTVLLLWLAANHDWRVASETIFVGTRAEQY